MRGQIHLLLHLVVPGIVVALFFRDQWLRVWAILVATMIVDLDHLLADPLYDPDRCSIGYHPLHTLFPILGYVGLFAYPKSRLVGLGLLIHMALDSSDCWMMGKGWFGGG